MNIPSKIKRKFNQSGLRGVVASALHFTATRIDPYLITPKRQTDEFLEWICFAVPGMLAPGNTEAMEYAISHMPPNKPILEIGSFCGLSATVMTYLLDKHSISTPIFTCDKWEFETQKLGSLLGDSPVVIHDTYQAYAKATFLRSMKSFAGHRLPYTIECFSDEFFRRWFENETTTDVFDRPITLGGEFGFCYIDGNHTYAFAKRDFKNADRALVSGGFILFDDSADHSDWEVNQLTREIAADSQYDLISKNENYLFRKK